MLFKKSVKIVLLTVIIKGISLAEHFNGWIARYIILLSQFLILSCIDLCQDDTLLLEYLCSSLPLRLEFFAMS